MNRQSILSLMLCAIMVLTGCASGNGDTVVATATAMDSAVSTAVSVTETTPIEEISVFSSRDLDASFSEADSIPIELRGNSIFCESNAVAVSGTTATIQKGGTYLLSGTLDDGTILIDADKTDKIQLVLVGVSIHSETQAAIYIRQADKVFVTLAPNSENNLSNGGSFTPDGETNVDAVVFSREDLTLNGTGTLSVTSPGGHGIVSKDALRITGGTYAMDVSAHGLCGKDEVSIADGSFDIIAGKDGIHADNSEDTDAGTVYLENGTYRITAGGDGISASGNCRILDGEYTITTGGGSTNAPQHTSSLGETGQRGVGRTDGMEKPQRTGDFQNREMGGRGGMGGNRMMSSLNDTSAEETEAASGKGIKALSVTIDGGTFRVDSADDGLHADENLTMRGGTLEVASGDDGIHADEMVTVISGSIRITESYEGIEGLHIRILGGEITLTASDDGLNAAGGMDSSGFGGRGDTFAQNGDTPSIVISGGIVNVTSSGDGIDANGTVEITGGTVIVSGPTYGDTSVLDYDLSGSITGGTFIGTGASRMAQTFSTSTQGVISVNVGTQSAGTEISLKDNSGNAILSYTPEMDFEIVIFSSPDLQQGANYTLHVGNKTQTLMAE